MYVIAKIGLGTERCYRGVASFHWQYLNGADVARMANRFLQAVKNPTNSLRIQADLETFRDYDGGYTEWGRKSETFVPYPYITMLYRFAAVSDFNGRNHGVNDVMDADQELAYAVSTI